jgi:hypothetical protein
MNWYGRKFRNPPPEQIVASETDLGEHIGDWIAMVPSDNPFDKVCAPKLVPPREATLVTSVVDYSNDPLSLKSTPLPEVHAPVLDLDIEHIYYESSTPGHAALLLNVQLDWTEYVELLTVLNKCGIIQDGFFEASIQRGYSSVRTPWTKKIPKEN